MKDCQICEKILGWFREAADVERTLQDLDEKEARVKSWEHYNTHNQSPIDAFVIRLGSFEEALSSPCTDHTALIRHLKQHIIRNWHGDGQQDLITVLWVEWENGIAYRQACGRIKEEAWNVLEPEEFDLVLG
jgi:hypothetical protein